MNALNRLIRFLERKLGPIATKIEGQRHLSTIKDGMISLMTVLMIGSISLMIALLGNLFPEGSALRAFFTDHAKLFQLPVAFTFGILSIHCAISISIAHARKLNVPVFPSIVGGVLATALLCVKTADGKIDSSYLDSRGIFVAIFASMSAVELLKWLYDKKDRVKKPGFSEMVSFLLESVAPIILVTFLSLALNQMVKAWSGGKMLPEILLSLLFPLIKGLDSYAGVFFLSLLEMTFWFLGLNGYAIFGSFVLPFMTHYVAENAAAFAAGGTPEFIFTENWWSYFLGCTGSGLAGALAILALFSKSETLRKAGKAGILPALFNISEPIVYGLPVIYNLYFFIPFVFGSSVLGLFTYFVFDHGWIRAPVAHMGGMPTPLGQFLVTLDWRSFVLVVMLLGLAILMYYPFFKAYEKTVLKKEEEKAKEAGKEDDVLADLDLDF